MREKFKDVEFSGRKWRIERFSALTGNSIAIKLLSKLGNIMAGVTAGVFDNHQALAMAIMQELGSFSSVDLFEIQNTCLSVCKELKYTGDIEAAEVIRMADGRWVDKDLSEDGPTVLALTCHALAFNLLPFFDANAWKSIGLSFKAYSTAMPEFFS